MFSALYVGDRKGIQPPKLCTSYSSVGLRRLLSLFYPPHLPFSCLRSIWCDGVYKEDVKCLVCLERMHSPTNSIVYTNSTIVGTNGEDVSRGN